jgi:hypothetical protein
MAEALLWTPEQKRLHLEHQAADDALAERFAAQPQLLTSSQHRQMERDLERLLPKDYFTSPDTALMAKVIEENALATPTLQSPYTPLGIPKVGRKWCAFPKAGLVYHDKPSWMQRVDQGQDFEILWGTHIIASGWGKCVAWLHDRPFPYGFGSPYMVVYFGSGLLGGRLWYGGHVNYVQIRPGETFHTGRALGRAYNSLTPGRGWIEWGHAANGYPMSMSEGAKWHYLFEKSEWRWSY